MITLKQIVEQLKYSELAGFNLGNSNGVGVTENHYNEIFSAVNVALLEMHNKIPNPLAFVTLTLNDNITLYQLDEDFIESNQASVEPVKYLSVASGTEFKPNVRQVVSIKSYDPQKPIVKVNDAMNDDSIWIRSNSIIEIPNPKLWDSLRVTYSYEATLINTNYNNDTSTLNQEVDISQSKLRPLTSFIVYTMLNARPHLDPTNTRFTKRQEFFSSIADTVSTESVIDNENDFKTIFDQNGYI